MVKNINWQQALSGLYTKRGRVESCTTKDKSNQWTEGGCNPAHPQLILWMSRTFSSPLVETNHQGWKRILHLGRLPLVLFGYMQFRNEASCYCRCSTSDRYHQVLIGVLWQIVVHADPAVRSSAAPLFTVSQVTRYHFRDHFVTK